MKISTGKINRPQKVVLYGPEGIGKTTLASKFPDPLFIDTEGSTIHLDVKRADPAPTSWVMLLGYINAVIADPTLCQTLVIDTADWAERLCVEHVLAKNKWTTIESPGYGKGYREVNEEFGRLLDKLFDVIGCGVNVVVTAHARIAKFEQPDALGAYDRWSLKLFDSPKSSNAAMLKEWADMVLFLNYKTNIVNPDSKTGGHAKASGGKRVMYTTHTPAWDAKNRCGLKDELPMEYASIASCIPGKASKTPSATAKDAEPAPPSNAGLNAIMDAVRHAEEVKGDEELAAVKARSAARVAEMKQATATQLAPTQPTSETSPERPPAPAPPPADSSPMGKLRALMAEYNVSDERLMKYSFDKGYCPKDTPIDVYPEGYINILITNWLEIEPILSAPF